jgi:hypothetical protein
MKNKLLTVLVIAALVVIAGIYFYASSQGTTISDVINNAVNTASGGTESLSDRGHDGYWNEQYRQCWSTPNALDGGNQGGVSCCFDIEGYQVQCEGDKRLSDAPYTLNFAIFQKDYPSGMSYPEKFGLASTFTISNPAYTGGSPLEKVWIESATWTSSPINTAGNTILNAAYAPIVGINAAGCGGAACARQIPVGSEINFPTNLVDLQALDNVNGTVYTLTMVAKSEAYGWKINNTQTYTNSFRVTKEFANFNIVMTWGSS